jgi:hypothetical protein
LGPGTSSALRKDAPVHTKEQARRLLERIDASTAFVQDHYPEDDALPCRSVHRTGRCCACELRDGISDPAPDRCAVVIAVGGKFIVASGAFYVGVIAVTLEVLDPAQPGDLGASDVSRRNR